MNNILQSLRDANARLWRKSKLLWLIGLGLVLCLCCTGLGSLRTLMPGYPAEATATAEARSVQATASAIETENAQAIATMTQNARPNVPPTVDVLPTMTYFAELVDATQTAAAKRKTKPPAAPSATATIFTVVVTSVPSAAPAKALPTLNIAPTQRATSGKYVASSEAKKYFYCVTDPEWKDLKATLVWSDDPQTFVNIGLELHAPCP